MKISERQLQDVIAFHGHFCPGLATGIRVAEIALAQVGRASQDEEVVAVAETQNCAVDAIQYLVGCTPGKGNLIIEDFGRNRFTFGRRADGHAVRISRKPGKDPLTDEQAALVARVRADEASRSEIERYRELWEARGRQVLARPSEELFTVEVLDGYRLPEKAVIEPSLSCSRCGLDVMASKSRQIDAEVICDACWQELGSQPLSLDSIGVTHSSLQEGDGRGGTMAVRARIELLPILAPALAGLEPGQRLDVLWAFDRSPRHFSLLQHPRGDRANPKRGIFGLRTPRRPAPIALTTVTLVAIEGAVLTVEGFDGWDGTPILDIKPSMAIPAG